MVNSDDIPEDYFEDNSRSYGKTYETFAEHPSAPLFFKYIDILISKGLSDEAQRLRDIANAPLDDEIINIITPIVAELEILIKDDHNEFLELAKKLDKPS